MDDEPDSVPDPLRPNAVEARGRWLAASFGLGRIEALTVVSRGAMGEVLRADTAAGPVAVKRLFGWNQLTEQVADRMSGFADRCRSTGVSSPVDLRTPDGALLAADDSGTVWRCAEWITGNRPDRLDVDAARWLAGRAATIHGLRERPDVGAELDPWYRVSDVDWVDLAGRASDAGREWAPRMESRAAEFDRLGAWAGAVPVADLLISHNDLTVQNTLVAGDRRWVLDWEQVGPAESRRELGLILIDFWRNPVALQQIAAAYRAAGGEFDPTPDLFATGVCVWLNFLSVQAEVLLDNTAPDADQRFAGGIVSGLLDHIPTLDQVAGAAAALRRRQ